MSLLKTIGNILQTTILRTKRSSKQITTDDLLIATNEDLKRLSFDISDSVPKTISLTIGGTKQDLSTDRIWYWTPYENPIQANQTVIVPSGHQQIIKGTLYNYGTIKNYGTILSI